MINQYVLFLDLVDDPALQQAYKDYHQQIPAAIENAIKAAGIVSMQIYATGSRMVMIMKTTPDFSFEKKALADASNPDVQAWEALMWRFQKALPQAREGEKWIPAQQIFDL
jgi:L-rhamnose mutarotase